MTGIPLGPFVRDPAYAEAIALDSADPMRRFRDEFSASDPDLIYLDGNSLGRLPKRTIERVHQTVESEWGHSTDSLMAGTLVDPD